MRSSVFTLLHLAAIAAEQNREHDLSTLLAQVRSALDPEDDPRDMLAAYYLAGLSGRVEGHRRENLYLRGYEQPQIDLFRLLAEHLPFVRVGMLANAHLLDHLRGHATATVLSIGIGQGRQESALPAQAAIRGLPLRRLVVIGVDPAVDSLAAADINLKRAGAEHGIDVTFHPVPAATEELDEDAWTLIGRSPRPLLMTASFALHHMVDPHPGRDARDVFLRRLRALGPAAVVLCEPDSDHHRVSLPERFANSWQMFGTLFEAIDATPLARAERDAMKSFFGREIIDIVGTVDERNRYERHEPTVAWLRRLRRCGFRTTVPVITPELERTLAPSPDFTLSVRPDHVRLGYRQDSLVSMMAAVPASAAPPDPDA